MIEEVAWKKSYTTLTKRKFLCFLDWLKSSIVSICRHANWREFVWFCAWSLNHFFKKLKHAAKKEVFTQVWSISILISEDKWVEINLCVKHFFLLKIIKDEISAPQLIIIDKNFFPSLFSLTWDRFHFSLAFAPLWCRQRHPVSRRVVRVTKNHQIGSPRFTVLRHSFRFCFARYIGVKPSEMKQATFSCCRIPGLLYHEPISSSIGMNTKARITKLESAKRKAFDYLSNISRSTRPLSVNKQINFIIFSENKTLLAVACLEVEMSGMLRSFAPMT